MSHRTEPCANCPFRRTAQLAYWHPAEYVGLALMERDEENPEGPLFQCHKDRTKPQQERQLCVGWLMDQRRKGLPSIALRVRMTRDPGLRLQYGEMPQDDGFLYESVQELVDANAAVDPRIHTLLRDV